MLAEENVVEYDIVRRKVTEIKNRTIKSSLDVYNVLMESDWNGLEVYESFFILLLDRSKRVVSKVKISQGNINSTLIDLRLIAFHAIKSLADAVIIAHNHPSGNILPSELDTKLTKKIEEGLAIFSITLLDHLIVTPEKYFSYADEGIIN